ncbi:Ff.00g022820.m01.CDS01 [Fusarium sp. VM40]|nr:Ff.00g022820.m01.CDS01 [Fusarium sp. VM40]
MTPYTISIRNQSGAQSSYAVFSEIPHIKSGIADVKVTTRIMLSVRGVASGSGQASFVLSKQLYATCGTYDVDWDSTNADNNVGTVGTGTEVVDIRPVVLGRIDTASGGKLVPGTSLEIDGSGGSPSFTPMLPDVQDGEVGSFAIRTKSHFTFQQAKLNKYVVGFSSSARQTVGPYATFVPAPNSSYQIKPSTVFYVTIGEHNVRDLVLDDLRSAPSTCRIDFSNPETDDIQLVHSEFGVLNKITAAVD